MLVRELFVSAIRSLWSNKRRSFLTMLGIIIGVAAVITILSLGDGLRVDTLKSLQATEGGEQSTTVNFNSMGAGINTSGFNERDIEKVKSNPTVIDAKAQADEEGILYAEGNINGKSISAPLYLSKKSDSKFVVAGRGFGRSEILLEYPVALVSENIAKKGYRTVENALNASIELNGVHYTIVGVISDRSEVNEGQFYEMEIPRKTYLRSGGGVPTNNLKITFTKGTDVSRETRKIVDNLNSSGSQHAQGNYSFMDMSEMLKGASDAINAITYFIVAIASISLFIAGIGVMNMMYISVSERNQEIGIRMAVGATQRQILCQFLVEAVMLTLTGGMLGYLSGLGIARVVSNFMPFKSTVSISTFLLAFGTSTFIGLIFGILPAKTASNKNLIEILR